LVAYSVFKRALNKFPVISEGSQRQIVYPVKKINNTYVKTNATFVVCYCYTAFKVLNEPSKLNHTRIYNLFLGTIYLITRLVVDKNFASKKAQIELN